MNEQDNNAKSKAVDSLLNFETVDMSDSCFLKAPIRGNMNMYQIHPLGKILQCRELRGQPLWGRHLEISGWCPLDCALSQLKLLTLWYYAIIESRDCSTAGEMSRSDRNRWRPASWSFFPVFRCPSGRPRHPWPSSTKHRTSSLDQACWPARCSAPTLWQKGNFRYL